MGLKLYLQVYLLRTLNRFFSLVDQFLVSPKPLRPAFAVTCPAKLSKRPGNVSLCFYLPRGYARSSLSDIAAAKKKKDDRLPLIVNFHSGGFIFGHPTDDARWATALLDAIDAVFVSIGYRMGPEHPQPTAVEDCVDALRWLWAHGDKYGFDPTRTVITGFSCGGQLSFTVPLRYNRECKVEQASGPVGGAAASGADGKLAGIVSFYPSVNQAIPRQQKVESNPISDIKGKEPPWLHRIIDEAYYTQLPPEGRASLNMSPALASRDQLLHGLPQKVAIFTTEWDKLLVEGEDFREALKSLGKTVGGRLIENVGHGFDKKPGKNNQKERQKMYRDAIEQIKTMV